MPRSHCPIASTLDIVGDRWTLLLIRDLLFGKARYGDFLASAEHIPTNILADRLKRLEREGLISRVPYSQHPLRVEYHLTHQGRALGHAVDALADWGMQHFSGTRRGYPPSLSGTLRPADDVLDEPSDPVDGRHDQ